MFPLTVLMLMLAPALANVEPHSTQVCFTILKGEITTTRRDGNISTTLWNETMTGNSSGYPYFLKCKNNETFDFKYNICLNALVIPSSVFKTEYLIDEYGNCTEHQCKSIAITPLINTLDGSNSGMSEMFQLLSIRDTCADLLRTDDGVKKSYIDAERKMIHNIMATTPLENERNKLYDMDVFYLNVVNISDSDLDTEHKTIKIEAPQLVALNVTVPEVWLPVDELRKISKEKRIIGLVIYMENSHFENRVRRCCYFDEENSTWKSDGCETYNNSQFDIICDCSHTTPFAVLLIKQPVDKVHWEILSYLSYIGCGLSAFFTSLSLIIYVFGRRHKLDYSISIHVSLSGALFLLNTTFLMTEWGATVDLDWVCIFVAAVMHYSLLCSFTWMAIEALHLYLLLIKVFNTYYKHYMVKLSLVGWGIPGLIVGVSLAMKDYKQFYGITQMTMADINQTNAICWITDESFFYSLNLVYFIMIFIFNSSILVAVASSICKMKQATWSKSKYKADTWGDPKKFSESCKSGLTVLGLTCLMGTTWGLAFLGSGYINYPILYLFCILNSAQGFFVFLWICLSTNKQRKRDMEERMISTGTKISEEKSD